MRRSDSLRSELVKPSAKLQTLSLAEGQKYVRAVNEVLAVRNRELFPLTSANPEEVYLYKPGRGLTIAVYGMAPDLRLPMETNYGALLMRNGIPIGYGVAAVLFDRVEIAINMFPAFRAGESAYVIEQFFRMFYRHFGSRLFLVRNTQMGYGEEEALHSGAFWFYYKLGFRAVITKVRKLAERENAKAKKRKGYRTPLSTMKRLAISDVFFHVDLDKMGKFTETSIINLGYKVTDYYTKKCQSNRNFGTIKTVGALSKLLKIKDLSAWTENERVGFNRLAPLIASIPNLGVWSREEKSSLVNIIRAKGSKRERKFVLLSKRHLKFKAVVEKLAK